jgi:hypothetical protein
VQAGVLLIASEMLHLAEVQEEMEILLVFAAQAVAGRVDILDRAVKAQTPINIILVLERVAGRVAAVSQIKVARVGVEGVELACLERVRAEHLPDQALAEKAGHQVQMALPDQPLLEVRAVTTAGVVVDGVMRVMKQEYMDLEQYELYGEPVEHSPQQTQETCKCGLTQKL